jgi:hypothetical protein
MELPAFTHVLYHPFSISRLQFLVDQIIDRFNRLLLMRSPVKSSHLSRAIYELKLALKVIRRLPRRRAPLL